jgi:hypothetical protein
VQARLAFALEHGIADAVVDVKGLSPTEAAAKVKAAVPHGATLNVAVDACGFTSALQVCNIISYRC